MKLSLLVYNVVKNVKYLDDFGFTYEAFKKGDFDGDQDYSNSINNAFAPINEAIHRLSDRDKIPFILQEGITVLDGTMADLSSVDRKIKKIKCVYARAGEDYRAIPFREMGKKTLLLLSPVRKGETLGIQFAEDIRPFSRSDYSYFADNNGYVNETDVDLDDYGISETACCYITEYAQGKLQEQIAPELANMHITRSEQYFDDLEEAQTAFYQQCVERKYGI